MSEHSSETVYVLADKASEDSGELQDHTHQDNQEAAASGFDLFTVRAAGRPTCSRRLRLNTLQKHNPPDMAQLVTFVLYLVQLL